MKEGGDRGVELRDADDRDERDWGRTELFRIVFHRRRTAAAAARVPVSGWQDRFAGGEG